MGNTTQRLLTVVTFLLALTSALVAQAQNRVVVIPMAGDDIMPKPFAPLAKTWPLFSDYELLDSNTERLRDKVTGLEWQRQAFLTQYNHSEALQYCIDLELGGKSDWRLPEIAELISIVDYQVFSPSINLFAFPGAQPAAYWSATNDQESIDRAFILNFLNGLVTISAKILDPENPNEFYTRCVR